MLQSDEKRRGRAETRYSVLATRYCLGYNEAVKPNIFVVEDDPDISRLVRHHLENEGFAVRVYPTGSTVLSDAERQRPALFVLDIMVPGKDGLELCRTVRQTPGLASVPVIFLTAKSSEADRILGLEIGDRRLHRQALRPRELVARVRAVLRRFQAPAPAQSTGSGRHPDRPLGNDPDGVRAAGFHHRYGISPARLFCPPPGAGFLPRSSPRFRLARTLHVTPRSVDVYVRRIREKIEPDPENPRYLKTVRGAGYRFEAPK